MRWNELKPGDVLASSSRDSVWLLVKKEDGRTRWAILGGYMAGQAVNDVIRLDLDDDVHPDWQVFKGGSGSEEGT